MTKRTRHDETLDLANIPSLDRGGGPKRQCSIGCGSEIESVTMNKMKIVEDLSKAEDDTGFSFGKLKTFVAEYDVEITDTVADTFRSRVASESQLSSCVDQKDATPYDQSG